MQRPGQQGQARRPDSGGRSELVTQGGKTTIADVVVAKIASMAARQVGGVHEMGAGMSRTIGSMRERMPGMSSDVTQGVQVQVGERQAAVDIDVVVEYGVSIPDLANAVRRSVSNEIEHMCGLEVVEVNIAVDDVHLAEDDEERQSESRGSDDHVDERARAVRGAEPVGRSGRRGRHRTGGRSGHRGRHRDDPGRAGRAVARRDPRRADRRTGAGLRRRRGADGRAARPRRDLPGGAAVRGRAVRDGTVEVGVVVRYGRPLPLVAADVRGAVRPLCEGRAVDVLIADVLT
ncbi:hypothetical protein BJF79_33945 [Actinomadura sp. CNU-125]|nr:hypothetical protein BJF79_33945 [Actinomadura sp. CNU-125]